ncbi:LysR family transcriptional regulator [Bradyrhizobium sp. Ash2021]|uniref:LysR family transcriptional regulator n=1 Tax=Bradyrhizobium sp. Ash2021 TaxID=2954771 RepID=UPI002815663E|nr:LysR family transcriptional regulator [Bradyrhizobium sp. Ash2021]WMT74544.1 LysR family transcriptional regulator [Bradyrhizobium sp. Ash2021]
MDRLASLEAFVRVVDEGSFTAAARSLRLSPAMVSKHVNALERRLGARLLHRTTRRVALTESGRIFYDEATTILRALDEAERALSARSGQPTGLVRFTAPVAFSERYVAPLLPKLIRRHPGLEIDLVCDDNVIDLVQGRFDAALRIGKLPDSSLIARKLAPVDVLVCGSPSYFAKHGHPAVLDDLMGHVCIGYEYQWTGEGWGFQTDGGKSDIVLRLSRTPYRSNNAEMLLALAIEGFGLVQLPSFIVGPDVAAGRLVAVLTQYKPIERWVHIVYAPGRHLPAAVKALSDFFASAFRVPPWTAPHSPFPRS